MACSWVSPLYQFELGRMVMDCTYNSLTWRMQKITLLLLS